MSKRAELRRQWREHCETTGTEIPFRQWSPEEPDRVDSKSKAQTSGIE